MKMDAGMDTGAILTQEKTPIHHDDDSQTLHDRLAQIGAALLVKTIPDYVSGKIQPHAQPAEDVSYAPKIRKSDGAIDWTQPARAIWNRVRALVPWPGAFTHLTGPQPSALLKILAAEVVNVSGAPGEILRADSTGIFVGCGAEALCVRTLQREGGRRLNAREFLAGHPIQPGQKLG
jgi:methionyl-tRNA formyltransferase